MLKKLFKDMEKIMKLNSPDYLLLQNFVINLVINA